jgi:hypothetical protein
LPHILWFFICFSKFESSNSTLFPIADNVDHYINAFFYSPMIFSSVVSVSEENCFIFIRNFVEEWNVTFWLQKMLCIIYSEKNFWENLHIFIMGQKKIRQFDMTCEGKGSKMYNFESNKKHYNLKWKIKQPTHIPLFQ